MRRALLIAALTLLLLVPTAIAIGAVLVNPERVTYVVHRAGVTEDDARTVRVFHHCERVATRCDIERDSDGQLSVYGHPRTPRSLPNDK